MADAALSGAWEREREREIVNAVRVRRTLHAPSEHISQDAFDWKWIQAAGVLCPVHIRPWPLLLHKTQSQMRVAIVADGEIKRIRSIYQCTPTNNFTRQSVRCAHTLRTCSGVMTIAWKAMYSRGVQLASRTVLKAHRPFDAMQYTPSHLSLGQHTHPFAAIGHKLLACVLSERDN